MKLFKINSNYKISVKIGNADLTFTGEVLDEDDNFFKLLDIKNETITFNKNCLIKFVEIVK